MKPAWQYQRDASVDGALGLRRIRLSEETTPLQELHEIWNNAKMQKHWRGEQKMTKMIKMENCLWPEFLVSVYSWNSARQNCPLWCFLSTCFFFCCVFSCEKYPFLRACQLSDWGERISRPQSVALPARCVNVARSSAHILPAGTTSSKL